MKTNVLFLKSLAGLLFFAGCASDEPTDKPTPPQKPNEESLTSFMVDEGKTRTTASYDGSGLNFYWTVGDRLWVNDGTLKQDKNSNIVNTAAKAIFYFEGTYTAPSYPVRYTGTGSTTGDKVTIKSEQFQQRPNEATHIGTSGDCGTAVALNQGDSYSFALDHKAAYLTLVPYNTSLNMFVLSKIKITADNAICGQFDFDDNGLNLASRPVASAANQSITLKLSLAQRPESGFRVPTSSTPSDNAATIVLAPGTYSTFTVDYIFYTYTSGYVSSRVYHYTTYSKTYHNLVFTAGKNKVIETDFNITSHYRYPANYHSGEKTNSIANSCPNMNEIIWYVLKGDPHWDDSKYFTVNNRPYNGGMWLKKQSVIAAENGRSVWSLKNAAPNGVNYGHSWLYDNDHNGPKKGWPKFSNTSITMGEPANPNDYFFLPALGEGNKNTSRWSGMGEFAELYSGVLYIGFNSSAENRYYMTCHKTGISCGNSHTYWMMQAWPAVR